MPRTVDVDAERVAGATDYKIKDRVWRAEEPSIDTFKQVLEIAPLPPAPGGTADDDRRATIAGLDSILPQLQLLLTDPDNPEVHPSADDLSTLSVRRANALLQEILGEGPGATSSRGGGQTQ